MKKMKENVWFFLFLPLLCLLLFLPRTAFAARPAGEALQISLEAVPEAPYPGETVRVQARVAPRFDAARQGIRWEGPGLKPVSGDVVSYEAWGGAATLKATLWDRVDGNDLAAASITVAPRSYALAVRILTTEETVRLWNIETKSMKDQRGRAVKTRILLEASIEPAPSVPYRCLWTPSEGTTLALQEGNRCSVYRDTPGTASVSLQVLTMDNLLLGTAEVSFDVDVSSEALDRSRRLSEGWGRWQSALALREKGEVETALTQARQAAEEMIGAGMREEDLRGELGRFTQVRNNYFRALELAAVAATLWRDGRLEEALAQYREARTFYAHPSIDRSAAEIENTLARNKELRDRAAAVAREAGLLAQGQDLEGALEKYRESLRLYPDAGTRAAQAEVQARRNASDRKMEVARAVRDVALTLESQGDLESALEKLNESKEVWLLPDIDADIARVQSEIAAQRNNQEKAARLEKEGAALEVRGLEGQGSPAILIQAFEKYRESLATWRDVSVERAVERVSAHVARINDEIAQAAATVKEAEILEEEVRLREALSKYRRSQELRWNQNVEKKIEELVQLIDVREKTIAEAKRFFAQARELEVQEKLDEALENARRGEKLLASKGLKDLSLGEPDGSAAAVVKRLENAVEARNGKIARASELARQARAESNPERALDLFLESENVWHDEEVSQAIRSLSSLLSESRDSKERATALYKEAVVLDRESLFEAAEEKLVSSLTLRATPEAQTLLTEVRTRIGEKNWLVSLQNQPLNLRYAPLLPYTGDRTVVRIEGGAWTEDERLTYRWELLGNAKDNGSLDGGRAYAFHIADEQPVTVRLTVLRAGTGRELAARMVSVIARPRSVWLALNEETKRAKVWNASLKRLEEIKEFPTSTDVKVRAEISPLPESAVSYSWSVDPGTAMASSSSYRAVVRRIKPGTSRVDVTVKDTRGIVLGTGRLNFIIGVDKENVDRDIKRAQAWDKWLAAKALWEEEKRLEAVDKAMEASALDASDPDITHGLAQMREDLGKMEQASRLLAEASMLLTKGDAEEAARKIGEAEKLWPDDRSRDMRYAVWEAAERRRRNDVLAASFRAEGEALLARGAKAEALLRFQDSFLISKNDVVSKDIARLKQEIAAEKANLEKARELREKGNSLADVRHYSEAIEYFERSLKILPDEHLAAYIDLLRERATKEKVLRTAAAKLRAEGDALMKDKKTTQALAKYKESLEVWRDVELAAFVKKEEDKIAQATAARLRKEAEALIKGKKPDQALAKYRESLRYAYDDEAADYVKKADDAAAKKRSDALIKEAEAFIKAKKPEEALKRYRQALKETPDNDALIKEIQKLELTLGPSVSDSALSDEALPEDPYADGGQNGNGARDLTQADVLYREGNALYKQKKYREALVKYRESYKFSQSQKLLEFANQLEATLDNVEGANKLVQEGNTLYKSKKYKEALVKYKESLGFYPNPEVEAFIVKVEAMLR
ncbi:MAG: hypothetical protein LBD04_05590 [Synergistaceae bacterium]|jgi:tetratricopeptide (TPR) repeat protein|nr:hypothetical protein [Synergistaceae bacterium]